MSGLFAELKRRNVIRAGAFYGAAAWLLVQIATQVFPFFDVPNWTVRWVVIAAIIGLPFALAFSWFYEFTPDGLKLESELAGAASTPRSTGRKLDRWIIAILGLAVVLLMSDQLVSHKDATEVPGAAESAATPATKSIAVMPLTNEAGEQAQQYFSDGLSEDLITSLAQFDGLKVISRESSFRFRDSSEDSRTIGEKLGVTHLLEGSVRRAGDAVRISAELVDVADGSTLWSQRYDRKYKDLFALQDEIANAVATALKAKLLDDAGAVAQSDRPPSGKLESYQAMLKGRFYRARGSKEDLRKAIDFYNEAIRLDANYARAYTGLSFAWGHLGGNFLTSESAQQAYSRAREAAATALSLDSNMAAAHIAQGRLLETMDFDRDGAEAEYRRALQLAPNDSEARYALSLMLATRGQPREAVVEIRRALAADPLRAASYDRLSRYLTALGRIDEAAQASQTAIEMQPATGFYSIQLAIIEVLRGHAKEALRIAQRIAPGNWQDTAVAIAQQAGGDRAAGDAALKNLIDKDAGTSAYQIAEVYALRKQPDQAFEWLERARANRDPGIAMLLIDPLLLAYKDDPRFAAFCAEVRLPVLASAAAPAPAGVLKTASSPKRRL